MSPSDPSDTPDREPGSHDTLAELHRLIKVSKGERREPGMNSHFRLLRRQHKLHIAVSAL
jgi:hypothetical protein